MSATVYGRKALRRFERETGERLVHASTVLTTIDHRHFGWTGERWSELEQTGDDCGVWPRRSSCRWLFGEPETGFTRGLMRGPCRTCLAGCSELHRWDCAKLSELMAHVNPDYWPRPVHRPQWMDDPRRPERLLPWLGLDMPHEVLMYGAANRGSHWSAWQSP